MPTERSTFADQQLAKVELSVVIPCRNGALTLADQLDSLLSQECPPVWEVIVADNGSTDGTADLVRSYAARHAHVRLVDASRRPGINVGRNVGARLAYGESIVLCDADDVVQPGWLQAYLQAFRSGAGCVGGGIDRELPDGQVIGRERQLYTTNFADTPYPIGANCGFTVEAFNHVGGFDEDLAGGSDEIDFFWRAAEAGYPTVLVEGAVVRYRVRSSTGELFRQFYRYGRGNARLLRRFASGRVSWRQALLSPVRLVRGLLAVAVGTAGSMRRRRGVQTVGFQLGMIAEAFSVRAR